MISCYLSILSSSKHNTLIFLLLINIFIKVTKSITNLEADKYLQLGKECLSHGQLQEALTKFHSAIQADESNYLSYYHRGTTYLALRSPRKAINDFQKVIDLQPEFHAVRLTRIEVFLKLGDINTARQDIAFLEQNMMYLNEISELKAKSDQIYDYKMQADTLYEYENYESVINLLEQVITLCPYDTTSYSLKAKCHLQIGDNRGAIDSLKRVTSLDVNDYDSYFTVANLYYDIGEWQNALIEVRKCAQEDVHADCYQFYKKLRKMAKMFDKSQQAKSEHDYDLCVRKMDDLLREIKPLPPMVEFEAKKLQVSCHLLNEDYVATLRKCDEALEITKDPDIYCDKAEAYMNINHFDDAVQSFNEALNLNRDFERAQNGKEQALKRKKQIGKRDYYKILGVSRNANDDEIKSAYRALAKKWHPDKHKGDSKKTAEKKFRDAADAKEVLLNKEKRRLFDSGNDPLDPEQQGQQHHHFHGSPEDIFRMFNQHAGGARDGGHDGSQGFRFSFRF